MDFDEERSGRRVAEYVLNERKARDFQPIPEETERIVKEVVDACFSVHYETGSGLLESVYEDCLLEELRMRGIFSESQVEIPLKYKGTKIRSRLRLDLLVENQIIIELKAIDSILPLHKSQLITYLKLSGNRVGLIVNFNAQHLRDGISRIVY
ncbi:GxxExxY protein [Methanocella sp. CWC-04]|uniref:GxxExxY protein n=1 Tax=Methanooceanicella nereidis TaxID=2052831 RepID=A0AAP2W525_9EURY|nr:GxxExxY protein [Methanocella sp. CWC-04]MCD1293863.1 GxxExxY protein [Methanocella sp. CWC-04]